jgi:hypothetical protein
MEGMKGTLVIRSSGPGVHLLASTVSKPESCSWYAAGRACAGAACQRRIRGGGLSLAPTLPSSSLSPPTRGPASFQD